MKQTAKGLFGNDDWELERCAYYRPACFGSAVVAAGMWLCAVIALALLMILILGFSKIWGA